MTNIKKLYILLQNRWVSFNQTKHKASLGEGDSSSFNRMATHFSKKEMITIAKIHWRKKIFFALNLFQLDTDHPWVKGIPLCSNKRPHPFPTGDNDEIEKIHWRNLKVSFPRTAGPKSTKMAQRILGDGGCVVATCQKHTVSASYVRFHLFHIIDRENSARIILGGTNDDQRWK